MWGSLRLAPIIMVLKFLKNVEIKKLSFFAQLDNIVLISTLNNYSIKHILSVQDECRCDHYKSQVIVQPATVNSLTR